MKRKERCRVEFLFQFPLFLLVDVKSSMAVMAEHDCQSNTRLLTVTSEIASKYDVLIYVVILLCRVEFQGTNNVVLLPFYCRAGPSRLTRLASVTKDATRQHVEPNQYSVQIGALHLFAQTSRNSLSCPGRLAVLLRVPVYSIDLRSSNL